MKGKRDRCSIVMINGEFKLAEFLTFAKLLTTQSVSDVRRAYLQSIAVYPAELMAGRTGTTVGQAAYGFMSLRE
jgi:hypothetical protein